jgi:hypothetical protein
MEARLERRIEVVLVTTRAAASSLRHDGQAAAAVRRGIQLLDGMAAEVELKADAETTEQMAEARRELESLLD